MTQELIALREAIMQGRTADALYIVNELDDMGRRAIIRNIESYLIVLLIHLIKNQAQNDLPRSWIKSIRNSVLEIASLNLQDNKRAYYIHANDWEEHLEYAYQRAFFEAADEVNGGIDPKDLAEMVNKAEVLRMAQHLLRLTYQYRGGALVEKLQFELARLPGS